MQRSDSKDSFNYDENDFLAVGATNDANGDDGPTLSAAKRTGDAAAAGGLGSQSDAAATQAVAVAAVPAQINEKLALEYARQQEVATMLGMIDYEPGRFLNRKGKNPRGFNETEVHFSFEATPAKLAEMVQRGETPVLTMSKLARNFELPGTPANKPRTTMHAQGNVYLMKVDSSFPCSLVLEMGPALRGNHGGSATTDIGARGHHIVYAKEQETLRPMKLLLESDAGEMTNKFCKMYPNYLGGPKALQESIKPMPGNSDYRLVKFDSPIVAVVNSVREETKLPQLVQDATASLMGAMPISKLEVKNAVEYLSDLMKGDVNYVNLYDAMQVKISRAFHKAAAGAKGDEWMNEHEFDVRVHQKDGESTTVEKALNKKYSLKVSFLVEHKPHVEDAKDE